MSGDPEQEYFADGMVEEAIGMGTACKSARKRLSYQSFAGGGVRGDDRDSATDSAS
jgi:hypothetical protein